MTVTDPRMTRFMMSLDDAVELVLHAFTHGAQGDIFVQKAPAATMDTVVRALAMLSGRPGHPVDIIGTRHGEKLFETLLSREERARAEDQGTYFRIPPDLRDLNYAKYFETGETGISQADDYNSHNTRQLDAPELAGLLARLAPVQAALRGEPQEGLA